jgi:N-acetylmuramoyl-L-alanine amidase
MTEAKAFRWGGLLTAQALAIGLAASTPAAAEPATLALAPGPTVGVRLGVSVEGTRLVIDSPGPISVESSAAPDQRMVFEIEGLGAGENTTGGGLGLVRRWSLDETTAHAVLELQLPQPSRVSHRFAIPPGPGADHYRYVIDLVDLAVGDELAASATTVRPMRTVQVANLTAKRKPVALLGHVRKVVVIDAGHGGHDPGAQSGETDEKDITLAAALRLRHRLLSSGRYRVVMTRASDVFVPLEERVRIARSAGADLFIALHADSAGADPSTHGASVYTLSDHGETRVHQVLDGHEWFTRVAARDDPAVGGILLDLTQRTTLNRSNAFAQLLLDHLGDKIDLLPKSHRDAGYFVLLAPDVPAVLLEMGFITSAEDRARLTDPAQRDTLVDAVADAIDDYFDAQTRQAAS